MVPRYITAPSSSHYPVVYLISVDAFVFLESRWFRVRLFASRVETVVQFALGVMTSDFVTFRSGTGISRRTFVVWRVVGLVDEWRVSVGLILLPLSFRAHRRL